MIAIPGWLLDPWSGEWLVSFTAAGGVWPQFSADGGRLAYRQGSRLGILKIAASREWRTLRQSRGV